MKRKDNIVNVLEWSDIHLGQNWRNKATGREVIVTKAPGSFGSKVHLHHQSGRATLKQSHYFLNEYELITDKD